jgi:hypothetical protein
MDEDLRQYRQQLLTADQKAQEDFDKTVLTLSGGALGISFAFVKDIVGNKPLTNPDWLLCAWIAWGISVASVLASFYFSQRALRHAIKQVDQNRIYEQTPGRMYSRITSVLNAIGGVLFLVGVILIVMFAGKNLR